MRRSEREVTDCNEIRQILERAEVLRLAMHDEPYPYIVPVNFGFTMQDDQLVLFFHGAKVGKKCDLLQKNPHVSFEVEGKQQLIPPNGAASCTAGFAYESVIGQGIADLAPEEKKEDLLQSIAELQKAVAFIDWKQGFYDDVLSGKTEYYSNLIPELMK